MNIRKATPIDSLMLSRLCWDVQILHAQNHPGIFKMPAADNFAISFFEEMLADPAVNTFIAEENGSPAGYIVCKLMERPENPFLFARRYLEVDQISVRPQAQGKGVGAALLKQADILAMEWKVRRIQLGSWDFNTGAHAFFEKMGFKKFNYRFWKEL